MLKTCTKCKETKALDQFSKHKNTRDGLQSHCKTCNGNMQRRRNRRNGVKATMPKGFSTERYCATCRKTMHWTKYHADLGMCAACWRKDLAERAVAPTGVHYTATKKPNTNMQELLEFLDRVTA